MLCNVPGICYVFFNCTTKLLVVPGGELLLQLIFQLPKQPILENSVLNRKKYNSYVRLSSTVQCYIDIQAYSGYSQNVTQF